MTEPWVGEPSSEHRAVCVYAPTPADPTCGEPAAVHVMVDSAGWGPVALSSCDAHRSIARASGTPIDEHLHVGFCGLPGALWMYPPISACVIDDSGVEPALSGAAEMPARA